MRIFERYTYIKKLKQPVIATVGIFDGVHVGHRHVIAACVRKAKKNHGSSVVVTFYPHPLKIIKPISKPLLLSSLAQRLNFLEDLGVDACLVIPFDRTFARMSALSFVRDILVTSLKIKELFLGQDFKFGFKTKGSIFFLKKLSQQFGFRLHAVSELKMKAKPISSTYIRSRILKGDLQEASKLLGRDYSIFGKVIKGFARGEQLGFSTANIETSQEVFPPYGVYAIRASIGKRVYSGMVNIGTNPTFLKTGKKKKPYIEAHLFGFNKVIYGKYIEIALIKKIRKEKNFKNPYALIKQLKKDRIIAKAIMF
ncbi:MAG: bifunctional riboflavin kinase/FAD synthetase [Candidatus Omnitrophota bacterium]